MRRNLLLLSLLMACKADDPAGPSDTEDTDAIGDDDDDDAPPTALITPEAGGTVQSADGRVTLTIPPGAVDEPVEIGVTATATPDDLGTTYLDAWELTPDGLAFAAPVAVEVVVTAEDIGALGLEDDAYPLPLLVSHSDTHGVEPLGDSTRVTRVGDDLVARSELTHFSTLLVWSQQDANKHVFMAVKPGNLTEVLVGQQRPFAVSMLNPGSKAVEILRVSVAGDRDCAPDTGLVTVQPVIPASPWAAPWWGPDCENVWDLDVDELSPFAADDGVDGFQTLVGRTTLAPHPRLRCEDEGAGRFYAVAELNVHLPMPQGGTERAKVDFAFEGTVECVAFTPPEELLDFPSCDPDFADAPDPVPAATTHVLFGDPAEACAAQLYDKYDDDETEHSSRDVPPKPSADDHTETRSHGMLRGTADADAASAFASAFPCGDDGDVLVLCDDPAAPFPPGDYLVVTHRVKGDIPREDVNHYQYGFVFDQNGIPGDNYHPPGVYEDDFFGNTDRWYEVTYTPEGGWSLIAIDATFGGLQPMPTDARVLIYGRSLVLVAPASELATEAPPFRVTAFRHGGDWGLYPPYDWSGDVTPPVALPLETMP